jgi:glycosyltransferase involved in cell wall biosynthesis
MEVSVIIPAYNAASTIKDCLTAVMAQAAAHGSCDVIVVDDGSSDETPLLAARLGATVIRQANQGQAAARNAGVRHSSAGIVVFTDADCSPAPLWLERMLAPFAAADITASKGAYLTHQTSLTARFAQIEYEERYERMRTCTYIDFVDTYSAAYRRPAFAANGGFNTCFPGDSSGEDQELSFRLAEKGHKMVFVPDAWVYHLHPATVPAYVRRKFKTGYWKALVLHLHPGKAVRDTHTPGSLKLQLAAVAASGPILLAGLFSELFWLALALVAIALAVTLGPFTLSTWRKDRAVGVFSPPMLVARALALGGGLVCGGLDASLKRGAMGKALAAARAVVPFSG